jgi:hypothetical protein
MAVVAVVLLAATSVVLVTVPPGPSGVRGGGLAGVAADRAQRGLTAQLLIWGPLLRCGRPKGDGAAYDPL